MPEDQPEKIGHRPEKYTLEYAEALAIKLREYTRTAKLPLWCEFAYENDCNFRKAQDLCKTSPTFREAYEKMHAKEESVLIRGGVGNQFNASITTLVLKNHRMSVDYREKQENGTPEDYANYFQDIKDKAAARKKKREAKP